MVDPIFYYPMNKKSLSAETICAVSTEALVKKKKKQQQQQMLFNKSVRQN